MCVDQPLSCVRDMLTLTMTVVHRHCHICAAELVVPVGRVPINVGVCYEPTTRTVYRRTYIQEGVDPSMETPAS